MSLNVRRLWSRKTIMATGEVSMMDLSMLSTVNRQCKIAKSLDCSSLDLFWRAAYRNPHGRLLEILARQRTSVVAGPTTGK